MAKDARQTDTHTDSRLSEPVTRGKSRNNRNSKKERKSAKSFWEIVSAWEEEREIYEEKGRGKISPGRGKKIE